MKKSIVVVVMLFLSLFVGTFVSSQTYAATPTPTGWCPSFWCGTSSGGISGTDKVNVLIKNTISSLFTVAGVVVLAYIIWAGFIFMTSGGESEKKEKAQKQIIAAVIGLLIIVFAYAIVNIVEGILNINGTNQILPPCPAGKTVLPDGGACSS